MFKVAWNKAAMLHLLDASWEIARQQLDTPSFNTKDHKLFKLDLLHGTAGTAYEESQ